MPEIASQPKHMPLDIRPAFWITFRDGNLIPYCQGHMLCLGVPAGVRFAAERLAPHEFRLRAEGYGDPAEPGDGCLFVWRFLERGQQCAP